MLSLQHTSRLVSICGARVVWEARPTGFAKFSAAAFGLPAGTCV